MVNSFDLYVCDECDLVHLGEDTDPVCMGCGKPMERARFIRQPSESPTDSHIQGATDIEQFGSTANPYLYTNRP